ncbi:MAG TPA: hypothetical protein VK557_03055 [Pyrinomonadaceae bacterium]|nr:hypothetical protein [Pyrinomonadaceae bacterium]
MENHPHRQPPTGGGQNHSHRAFEDHQHKKQKKTFTQFMLDSDVKPVVFVGKCVQYFGWGAVAGFLLGSVSVYGYALIRPLPYAKAATQPIVQPAVTTAVAQSSPVRLHGYMTDANNRPFTERFWVAVVAKQHGPEFNAQGSYEMEAPQSDCYDVMFWKMEGTVHQVTNQCAEKDGSGYKLDLRMPSEEARVAVHKSKSEPPTASADGARSQFTEQ